MVGEQQLAVDAVHDLSDVRPRTDPGLVQGGEPARDQSGGGGDRGARGRAEQEHGDGEPEQPVLERLGQVGGTGHEHRVRVGRQVGHHVQAAAGEVGREVGSRAEQADARHVPTLSATWPRRSGEPP